MSRRRDTEFLIKIKNLLIDFIMTWQCLLAAYVPTFSGMASPMFSLQKNVEQRMLVKEILIVLLASKSKSVD